MRRVFAGGFIVSSLQIISKCTALIIPLFDPTNGNDDKTTFMKKRCLKRITYYLTNKIFVVKNKSISICTFLKNNLRIDHVFLRDLLKKFSPSRVFKNLKSKN